MWARMAAAAGAVHFWFFVARVSSHLPGTVRGCAAAIDMELACESEWAAGAVSVGSAHRHRRAGGLGGRETKGYRETMVIQNVPTSARVLRGHSPS